MIERIEQTIRKHNLIENNEGVLIGLSGGPDSVCLLHVLNRLCKGSGAILFAVHVNHMLRGAEADADELYCRRLCESLGVFFHSEKVNVAQLAEEKGMSQEEAGREERYRIFEHLADRLGAAKIAVAHNRNDQVETVLMHIIRGTGLDGLKGMDYRRGRIIRPLLDIDRAEIEAYCRENALEPRTDKTNLESVYTRNRLRLELLPYLKENCNPSIVQSILRLSGLAREDADFLESVAEKEYRACLPDRESAVCSMDREPEMVRLDAKKLIMLHGAISSRIIRMAIRQLKGDTKGIEGIHINDIQMLCSGRTGAVLHLPANLRVRLSYGVLEFYFQKAAAEGSAGVAGDSGAVAGDAAMTTVAREKGGTAISDAGGSAAGDEAVATSGEKGVTASVKKRHVSVNGESPGALLLIPGITNFPEARISAETGLSQPDDAEKPKIIEHCRNMGYNSLEQFFDYDRLKEGISLRYRKEGDLFKPLKGTGTKKLKDYFIDRKIPRDKRQQLPLIAKDNEIVWIVGHKISDKFKVTENTNNILHIKISRL